MAIAVVRVKCQMHLHAITPANVGGKRELPMDTPKFDPNRMCEACGKDVARFQAPNKQLVCEQCYLVIEALDKAINDTETDK